METCGNCDYYYSIAICSNYPERTKDAEICDMFHPKEKKIEEITRFDLMEFD